MQMTETKYNPELETPNLLMNEDKYAGMYGWKLQIGTL